MNIPDYIQDLLCYQTKSGRRFLLNISTDYNLLPSSALIVPGYLYKLQMQKYKYPRCFPAQVNRLVSWANRNCAEAHIVKLVQDGWNTFAYITITDPVALALEKHNLVGGVLRLPSISITPGTPPGTLQHERTNHHDLRRNEKASRH